MAALAEHDAGVCSCGFHRSLTMDPSVGFTTRTEVCPTCAGAKLAERIRREADEAEEEELKNRPDEPRRSDGRHVYIQQLTEDEMERRRARARKRPKPQSQG